MGPGSAWVWRMSELTRAGTAEPVSRNQILRGVWKQGEFAFHFPFPLQLTTTNSKIDKPYPADPYSAKCGFSTLYYCIHITLSRLIRGFRNYVIA